MILIVGSTGLVGSAVTTKLSAGGKPVTAVVRDPASEKARALAASGAKLVVGDLKDRSSLEKALAGVDTVICTASSTISRREGDSLDTVDNKGVQSLGRDGSAIAAPGRAGAGRTRRRGLRTRREGGGRRSDPRPR